MVESPVVPVVALRWLHAVAAALWLGGGIVYLALRAAAEPHVNGALTPALLGRTVGRTLQAAIGVFVITGALLAAARLSEPNVSAAYVAVLAAKVVVALVMFALAGSRPRAPTALLHGRTPWWRQRAGVIVALGLGVYLLSIILGEIVEQGLRAKA
ncbi:MAG: hypothetical protein FJ029_00645 [Actinobacteria bacterium]|nr:hypothetical protein [Actinomycetota bacterium]